MKRSYDTGDKFTLTSNALENYGAQYAGVHIVTGWANHYCKPEDIGRDKHGHPGFDAGAASAIYSSDMPFDVYEWEMERVS